jgi:hypothetical protein
MNQNAALGQAKAARTGHFGDINTSNGNISPSVPNAQAPDQIEVFRERCEARPLLFVCGQMSLHDAVDGLQAAAERTGLIDRIGQDEVQAIMGAAFAVVRRIGKPMLISDDLRESPRWPESSQPSSRTPKATIDAFWLLVGSNEPGRLKAWLRQHPADAPTLLKLLEAR